MNVYCIDSLHSFTQEGFKADLRYPDVTITGQKTVRVVTAGQGDIDFFVERRLGESIVEIELTSFETEHNGGDEEDANSRPVDDGSIEFKIVNAFDLLVATYAEAGLEFLHASAGVPFAFECPRTWEDVLRWFAVNDVPGTNAFEGLYFDSHGVMETIRVG